VTATDPLVRSYKLRSRVTSGQARALDQLWGRYGIALPDEGALEPAASFGRQAPLVLDIGFGTGEATLAMAEADPARDVLAVEVHRPGAGSLLAALEGTGTTNVRVLIGDARAVLTSLRPGALDEVRVFFPDPWPKSSHHKRRLLDAATVHLVASRLRAGGRLHLATDWTPYAERVRSVVAAEPLLRNVSDTGYVPRPKSRPHTRFERRGLARGHDITDLVAERVESAP
jgi:tRNA (guanine-N7-)-methyltransferase